MNLSESLSDKLENVGKAKSDVAVDSLKKMINEWVAEKPNRNVHGLARQSGVSDSTLRRTLNSDVMPVSKNLYKILTTILRNARENVKVSDLQDIFGDYLTEIPDYLKDDQLKTYTVLGAKEDAFVDFTHLAIFERACSNGGISVPAVVDMFGELGRQAIRNLEQSGLVAIESDVVLGAKEVSNHVLSVELSKKFILGAVQNFLKTDNQHNQSFFVSESVSRKGYVQLFDLFAKTNQEALSIVQNNPGNIPVFAVSAMDTMTSENVIARGEK